MGNARVIKPAIQNRPATFGNLTVNGNETVNGVLSITGIENVSQSIAAASVGTPTLQQVTDQGASTTTPITASIISASNGIITNGLTNVGSTSTTLSSSFTTTLNFSTNRIMSVTTSSAVTMSVDADLGILGNVIMTDISSSVGLNLPSDDFKVLNGTFDTTKRNYVYYHYIGNGIALATINQEAT